MRRKSRHNSKRMEMEYEEANRDPKKKKKMWSNENLMQANKRI